MTPTQARDQLRRQLAKWGEDVTLRRYAAGVATDYPSIRARVTEYDPAELVGGIIQGDRKIILSGEHVESSGIALPLKKGDKIVVRGRELNIERQDDNTRRIAGELIGINVTARG